MTGKHPPEHRDSASIGLCMRASQADQSFGAMLARGQGAKMRSHVSQVATRGKSSPLLRSRILQAIFTVVCAVQPADRLPILFDESSMSRRNAEQERAANGVRRTLP